MSRWVEGGSGIVVGVSSSDYNSGSGSGCWWYLMLVVSLRGIFLVVSQIRVRSPTGPGSRYLFSGVLSS